MNRIKAAFQLLVGQKKAQELSLSDANGWQFLLGGMSSAGISVSEQTVLQMTTSWRCIRLISETIGTLPLHLYQKTDSGRIKATDHKLYPLLHDQPNPYMTSVEWVEAMVVSLCCWGQAYNDITRLGPRISGIMPVAKPNVSVEIKDGQPMYWYARDGRREPRKREEICPIKGFGAAGQLEGFPPFKMHSSSIGLTVAAEKYGSEFFAVGGRPSGVFSGDKWPTPENAALFKELFESSGNLPLFIGGNYDWKPTTARNDESQFMELREFQVREIANIWGVPSDRVLSKGGDTYNNTEHRNLQFLQTTLLPYIRRIEQSLNSCLLTRAERREYYIEFDFNGLLRGDMKTRSEYYRNMRNIAGITVNEMREKENLPRVEGGDDLHMPLNMAPLDQLREINADDANN